MDADSRSYSWASLKWLNVTQFLGALNDNVFKLLVIFFLVHILGEERRAEVIAMASGIFVLPFLLFSQAAGVLADRISKKQVILIAKGLEVVVMLLGLAAVGLRTPLGLYGVIFLMSTQSALFGPAKYGIVPELVKPENLSRANSLLVGFTYLAIIIGTFLPTFLLLSVFDGSFYALALFCVVVAAGGLTAALRISYTPAAGSEKRFSPWFVLEIGRTLRSISRDGELLLAVIGAAYFLFLGGFMQQNLLLYGREILGLSLVRSGYLFPVAAIGIGLGALITGRLSGRTIGFGVVPIGAAGLTLGCLALGLVPPRIGAVIGLIFIVGVSAGLYIVPLNAFIQFRSPNRSRGQVLACTSFLSFSGVALSAAALVLLTRTCGLSAEENFVVIGVLTGVLAILALALCGKAPANLNFNASGGRAIDSIRRNT